MVTAVCPYPPNSGNPLRTYNLISRLARDHDVWLITYFNPDDGGEHAIAHLRSVCAGVEAIPQRAARAFHKPAAFLRYLLRRTPVDLRFFTSDEMQRAVHRLADENAFDVVQIEDSYMALYFEALPRHAQDRAIITMHDLVCVKYDRIYRLEPKLPRKFRLWLHSRMMRKWEPRYMERFKCCVTMSEVDRRQLNAMNPRLKIEVVPNGVDTTLYKLLSDENKVPALLFVGDMSYRPNVDAAIFLCDDVLPLVRRRLPEAQAWLVGVNPGSEVMRLDGEGVHVTGRVDDVRPYYERTSVCVVPLRAGGGTRLKILEAMALGRPVVSTRIGCEGINVTDGEHILLAETPEEFADKVVWLITDRTLREYIVRNARQLVETQYDWEIITQTLVLVYAGMKA